MEHFYEKLAEILEVDAINASDVLADFPEWDSLSVLSAIAMVNRDYHVSLTAAEVRNCGTAQLLLELVKQKTLSNPLKENVAL
jgi:acyl carrier protein